MNTQKTQFSSTGVVCSSVFAFSSFFFWFLSLVLFVLSFVLVLLVLLLLFSLALTLSALSFWFLLDIKRALAWRAVRGYPSRTKPCHDEYDYVSATMEISAQTPHTKHKTKQQQHEISQYWTNKPHTNAHNTNLISQFRLPESLREQRSQQRQGYGRVELVYKHHTVICFVFCVFFLCVCRPFVVFFLWFLVMWGH